MSFKEAVVRRNVPPVTEAAIASLGGCDHVDAVAVDLATGTTAVEFTHSVLAATPSWVHTLLSLRDAAMAPFGLQTQKRVAAEEVSIESGRHLGPLRILMVSEEEVLAGDDDRHLDFRTSFAVRPGVRGTEGVCTTVVRCHNSAGRLYFRVIQPFHNLVIPRVAARAAVQALGSPHGGYEAGGSCPHAPLLSRAAALGRRMTAGYSPGRPRAR